MGERRSDNMAGAVIIMKISKDDAKCSAYTRYVSIISRMVVMLSGILSLS